MGNHPLDDVEYEESSAAQLRGVVTHALSKAVDLCGAAQPDVYFMGVSAGASTMAALASEFPALKKLLLVAPSADAGEDAVAAGLAAYRGELYVVVGENDLDVGRLYPESLGSLAPNAAIKKFVVVPRCDHQFTRERNGRILGQAPLWAFAGDEPFPDPERGILLYN
jgi:pimeloyl-ACP methyl ester carboxylesterase